MRELTLNLTLFLLIFGTVNIFAQENKDLAELKVLFDKLYFASNDSVKLEVNKKIKTELKQYISIKRDYTVDFETIRNLKTIKSDDKDIFIFTWAVKLKNENFKYFGFIKYYINSIGEYYIDELIDNKTINTANEQDRFNSKNWYGAVYYKIISKKYKKKRTYLLLAWDANDDFTNKKIIDILSINEDDEVPVFGKNIINYNGKNITRLVFEYGERVAMTLTYDTKLKMVIWDHLSPSKQEFKGIYKYYGPDLSFDALQFEKGFWKYIPDIELNK